MSKKVSQTKEFIIKLPRDYIISNNIEAITPEYWRLTLDFLNQTVEKYGSLVAGFDKNNKLQTKYDKEIAEYTSQIETLNNIINKLTINYTTLQTECETKSREQIRAELEKTKHSYDEQLKLMEDKYRATIANIESQQTIANTLHHERHQTEIKSYIDKLNERNIKLEELTNQINNNNLLHNTLLIESINKERETLSEQYKAELSNRLNDLQNNYEVKISNIKKEIELSELKYTQLLDVEKNILKNQYEIKLEKTQQDQNAEITLLKKTIENTNNLISELKEVHKTQLKQFEDKYNTEKDSTQKHYDKIIEELNAKYKDQITKSEITLRQKFEEQFISEKQQYEDSINNLTKQITEKENQLESEKENQQIILQNVSAHHEKRITDLKQSIETFREIINTTTLQNNNYQKNMEHNNLLISEIKKVKSQLDKLDPVADFFTGTNKNKGVAGENMVLRYLRQTYIGATITDVSSTPHMGDIVFCLNKMRLIIEIKNKQAIETEDMKKFEHDISLNASSKKINGGIFVSIRSNNFPGKTSEYLQIDNIANVPVIYLYMPIGNEEIIQYAIACFEKIIMCNQDADYDMNKLTNYLNEYFNSIKTNIKFAETRKEVHRKEINVFDKYIAEQRTLLNNVELDQSKYCISSSENIIDDIKNLDKQVLPINTSEAIAILKAFYFTYVTECKLPNVEEVYRKFHLNKDSFKQYQISHDDFVAEARAKHLANYFTPEILRKYMALRSTMRKDSKNLTKNDLVNTTYGIINEYKLREFSNIINVKQITSYIIKYCENEAAKITELDEAAKNIEKTQIPNNVVIMDIDQVVKSGVEQEVQGVDLVVNSEENSEENIIEHVEETKSNEESEPKTSPKTPPKKPKKANASKTTKGKPAKKSKKVIDEPVE